MRFAAPEEVTAAGHQVMTVFVDCTSVEMSLSERLEFFEKPVKLKAEGPNTKTAASKAISFFAGLLDTVHQC